MKLPTKNIILKINETTAGVPDNAKVNVSVTGLDDTDAVREALKDIHHTLRAYSYTDIQEKATTAIEKHNYKKAEGLVKALGTAASDSAVLLFTNAMEFIVAGKPTEILPLLLAQIKPQWTNGQKREFKVTKDILPQPKPASNIIDVKGENG